MRRSSWRAGYTMARRWSCSDRRCSRYTPAQHPEAALPRAVATALAFAMLLAAIMWLFCFSATLGNAEDRVETMRVVLFESGFGPPWVARLTGAGLALVAVLARRPRLVVAATLIALTCEGWSGHAAAWGFTGSLVQAAHVVCAGAWIGGLVSLALLVVRARKNGAAGPRAAAALRRFSRYGTIFVMGIALTGLMNTWHMLDGRLDLAGSYDRVLFAKVAFFAMMVTVAALNRYRLVPRLTRSDPAPVFQALSFTIVIELFIGAVVLLAVSALGLMNPYS